MSDSFAYLNDPTLYELYDIHRRRLEHLQKQAAPQGNNVSFELVAQIDIEKIALGQLVAEMHKRGLMPPQPDPIGQALPHPAATVLPNPDPAPPNSIASAETAPQNGLKRTSAPEPSSRRIGSPFVVGRALRADERMFGRDQALAFVAGELMRYSSVNVVAERRWGKTSFLHHLVGRFADLAPPSNPALIIANINLQGEVNTAERFYGAALYALLSQLPLDIVHAHAHLAAMHMSLETQPACSYDDIRRSLRVLATQHGSLARPVLVIDEFERLLDAEVRSGFPFPGFFNNMRALLSDNLLALVVASRRPLAEYFSDPSHPRSLTSTFPTYLQPISLTSLSDADAEALLLQASDHPLIINEALEARTWAQGHPCHIQIAGAAYYQMHTFQHDLAWARARREELKQQNCMTGQPMQLPALAADLMPKASIFQAVWRWTQRIAKAIFISLPIYIGRITQLIGLKLDEIAAWIIGMAVIVFLIAAVLGLTPLQQVLNALKAGLGLE